MGVSEAEAADHIKLVMLCNDVSCAASSRRSSPKGFGFFQSKPPSAFTPVAVTPDELGDVWKDSLVHLPLRVDYNGEPFGRAEAAVDATFSLARLVSHAAKTRPLTRGHRDRFGHGIEQGRGWRPGQTGQRGRSWLFLHCRDPDDREDRHRRLQDPVHESRRQRTHRDARCRWQSPSSAQSSRMWSRFRR